MGSKILTDQSRPGQTIHLTSPLLVDKNLSIYGTGLDPRLQISGDTNSDEIGDVQIMNIAVPATVGIYGIDFVNGKSTSPLQPGRH